jgi:hypothetical protein
VDQEVEKFFIGHFAPFSLSGDNVSGAGSARWIAAARLRRKAMQIACSAVQ